MNFPQLRAFHAVATHGTFSAAAAELGVSQPAITQHVKSLEEAAGAKLFRRTPSGVEMTPSGLDLLPRVREAMLSIDELGQQLQKGRALDQGRLALGLCAPFIAMPILQRFAEHHPGIRLDVRFDNSSRLLALVRECRIDIALATLSQPDPDLVCERVATQRVMILVPDGHPFRERDTLRAADLVGERIILREPGSMTRHLFERGLAAAGVAIDPSLVLGSREAMKEAAAAGLGLGIVLSCEVGHDPRLRAIAIDEAGMAAAEYLVALPQLAQKGTLRRFFEIAREEA